MLSVEHEGSDLFGSVKSVDAKVSEPCYALTDFFLIAFELKSKFGVFKTRPELVFIILLKCLNSK